MSWQYRQAYPNISKRYRVLAFTSQEHYFCLGKPTPWGDPDTPPEVPPDILLVPEPIVYIRPIYILPALRSPCGNKVICNHQGDTETWQVFYNGLYEDLGHNIIPTHVYVALEVSDDYVLSDTYRCTALLSHLKLFDNAPNAITYPPSLVQEPGVLEWVCFHSPVEKVSDRRGRVIEFMLEP